ncbi:NADPH:quinone reductase and related Zn-dependent oxidoreductase [Amycolatopsis mediterranei S699]|uniref:NADPH:quinone reductase and related Zn-dependent oxidoreductase n=2 Tax=Amycolatopsis mediterranei TaxID=33910 RepID=A0A0H3CXC5_AMYMU|nr:NADP-dependent oxidoreductase [Amycolatopsis mediterranei]ADJ43272.1 NADPH:quinone reductase and related Zn-dependent oxidoreductase [Amycolatopsis mediterranei U32]AEK39973.1 NADPH:quinone reductase and related Zn-dependent oxidoreductase [Amycolatopsis mediterranei S699]AFO74985.1 NADPH:quinone reductase and related Zn-dependent oxidoreductase [Amycolatopsis mediterranei S699]AGT82114.1 NADPH:quinone reductase-related Zn-dependent oxidoreductase [Amycolatopsis mediterranei RB]KDO11139.1 N
MRAIHVPAAGEQPQVGDLPVPAVADGSVLIRVKAAALNPVDNAIAAGYLAGMLPHEYPLVLGRDAAGVVEAVGAGVEHVKPGDEVFGHVLLAPPVQAGTLAEYAVLPAAAVAIKPAALSFVEAAALPLAAAAAVQAVDAIEAKPGQTVLVNGASGGVGSYAVQLLAAGGVTVIATGSDTGRLTGLGATTVVDRAAGPIAEQVLAAYPGGVDAVVNLFGHSADDIPLAAVRRGGKVSALTQVPEADAGTAAGVTVTPIMAAAVREVTGPLAEQAAAGTLKVDVGSVITLDQALDGLATIAAGHAKGKTVVTLDN